MDKQLVLSSVQIVILAAVGVLVLLRSPAACPDVPDCPDVPVADCNLACDCEDFDYSKVECNTQELKCPDCACSYGELETLKTKVSEYEKEGCELPETPCVEGRLELETKIRGSHCQMACPIDSENGKVNKCVYEIEAKRKTVEGEMKPGINRGVGFSTWSKLKSCKLWAVVEC